MKITRLARTLTLSTAVASMMMLSSCAEEGAEPELPGADRDKYVGSWLCKESVNGTQVAAFTINIQKVGQNDSVKVFNFSNVGREKILLVLLILLFSWPCNQSSSDERYKKHNLKYNLKYSKDEFVFLE